VPGTSEELVAHVAVVATSTVHSVVPPEVKVTVPAEPVGNPLALRVIALPYVVAPGVAATAREVATGVTTNKVVAEEPT
jgi:hypothetical protein